uniref:Moesin/ezrin/radixin homolog 1 n=1 Tax=Wuchereria bancrofti TaxID=6293 RepID=A0A1I8EGZ7_WUCBA
MGKKISEGELCNIQQATRQQPATVQFPDSTSHIFYVLKKAEGGELFDKVCAFLDLTEKDYFGLCFVDDDDNEQWIYDDKRISKQLKGHPWDFNFKVKFYPPEPATLAEDKTRHLLSLQVRHDISTGKLPATLATHALLGSYVAQSVRGDYKPSLQYIDFLRSCHLAPIPNEILYEKVEELHKNHKGETSAEAELHYLENAKKLSMYGVQLFHAKDGKNTPVQIGISAHGINIYLDQIRVHRFLWQNIIKIGYRRNIFIIKVKPGEPEEKPHRGLFRWGSARFRYQGRTQFQSKMASQMFCNSQPIQRSQSVRVTQNDENVAVPASLSHTLPLIYPENGTGRKLDWNDSQIISPEKIYSTHIVEATQKKEKDAVLNGAETYNSYESSKSDIHAVRKENMGFLPADDKAVIYHPGHYEAEMIRSKQLHEPPVEPGDDFVLVHRPKLGSTGKIFHQNGTETNILVKEEDIEAYPIHRFADIYHSGFSRISSGNKENLKAFKSKKILETDDIVDKLKVSKEKYPTSGQFKGPILHTERSMELPAEPLRSHTHVYNQGYYDSIDSNRKDIDEKGNIRNWLRCYKKSEKSQAKLLKEKDAEIKGKKLVNGDHTICKSETENEQEKKAKEVLRIHVKQPSYERQTVRTSYYNVESPEKKQETEYLKRSKLVTAGVKGDKSFDNDIKEETYESMQPKQEYHLFISSSDTSHVRPGAYGVPSTSYDELLHIIRCEKELPLLPIHEHVMIRHLGISIDKDKKRQKFLIGKEHKKTTSSETSTDEEMQSNKAKKCKAILVISEADKNDLAITADDAEKRPIDKEIKRKYMMHEMKEKDQIKVDATSDSEQKSQKITVKKDMKLADSQNVKNGSTRQKMKAIFHRSEDQNKLRNLKKETAVLKKPKESNDIEQTIQPTYSILGICKSAKIPKRAELLKQSQHERILDNTPPPLKLSRISETSFQPFHLAVKAQNQMQNLSHNYRTFKRAKHKGDVEFIAKENINPESYKRECTPYQGPLETTNYVTGLQFAPIHEYSAVYHPGNTYVKSRKVTKRKNIAESQNQEKSSTLKTKKIAALNLDIKNSSKHHEEKSDNESKNDDQVTAYGAKIVCKTPLEERRKVKKYSFKYRRIPGDVEIVEKPFVKHETYNLVTVPYDTPVSCLECEKELSFTPLQQCVTLYHSGISHKKAKRLRDSSTTESISSTSFSSSSSSSTYVSEKTKELKKKAMLHVISKKHDTNDVAVESSKHKRIFPFWRKTIHSEKEGKSADDKKEKLDISSKFHAIQHPEQSNVSVDRTASQATSSPSQIITAVLKKDSVEKTDTSLHVKSGDKKLDTNLHHKKEPLGTSEYDEDNGKRGKFGLFHFWRSKDKESNSKKFNSSVADMNSSNEEPKNHTTNLDSFHDKTNIRLTIKSKKKPITSTTDVKTNELAPSINMKEESLNRTSPSDQSTANAGMKKTAFIHLKRDSELANDLPLDSNSNAGIVTPTGISSYTLSRTNEGSKPSSTEKSQLVDKENNIRSCESTDESNENSLKKHEKRDYVGYIAKVKLEEEMRNVDEDLQQSSNLRVKETNALDDGINKRSSFRVKGFHLRGPPGVSEPKIASHNGTKYKPEIITENVEASGVVMTEIHEENSTDSASKPIVRKEVAELKVKKKSTGSDVALKENKKDNGKNIKGNFFSSFWRGNKSDEHQKRQKMSERNVHETEVTPVEVTSTTELEYNIPRTKIMAGSIKSSSDISHVEQQARQEDSV